NTGDTGSGQSYSVRFFDQDMDGKKDEILLGTDDDVYIYYENGTLQIDGPDLASNCYYMYDIEVGDIDGDGYDSEFVVGCGWSDSTNRVVIGNRTGEVINNTMADSLGDGKVGWITIGDINGDGTIDNIFSSYKCTLFNTTDGVNWNIAWNMSENCADAEFGDFDDDGTLEIVAIKSGNLTLFELNGTEVWATDNEGATYTGRMDVGSIDGDLKKNDFFMTEYHRYFLVNQSGQKTTVAFGGVNYWPNFIDIDGDGIDEIIYGNQNTDPVHAKYINETQIWAYDIVNSAAIANHDVNGDGENEIIIAESDGNTLVILNKSGILLSKTHRSSVSGVMPSCESGYCSGVGQEFDFGDLNRDGIDDIAVISRDDYLDIFQEVSCRIYFNDSNSYNMTWNDTLTKWQMNRTFATVGNYEYNITCEKG
ncbi:MAG: VCBS repeat-containing protein, partial [Candidatus Aenigmarchaeota archaeon]|nr:VCBS repeat-containing protein [Candidatus Aenigmarchaeota archaeon]